MAAVLDPLYGKGTREIRAAERRGHSRPSNGREPWSEHRTWRPLRCWPSRRWAHRCRAGPPHRLRSHAGRLLRETLRDALRVLAPIRYNPASSYPSFDRAKCNSIAELACRGLQWGVSVRRLLISGSEVRTVGEGRLEDDERGAPALSKAEPRVPAVRRGPPIFKELAILHGESRESIHVDDTA